MRRATALWAWSLLPVIGMGMWTASGPAQAFLSEFGIEGMGVVSTKASEVRATVSPDGQRIVWGSTDREGGPGGWDLWQARLKDGRWQDAQPLALNTRAKEFDPSFSADGRWLYFFSDRPGGQGGDDLYRVAVQRDGGFGTPENLGPGVNTRGDEWAPTPSRDGQALLFASDGHGGAGRHDLFIARWDGKGFAGVRAAPGVNTRDDEFDAAWLDDGQGLVFTRSKNVDTQPVRLFVARCDGRAYIDITPLALSFNTPDGSTFGPAIDWNKPGELLVTGTAKAPRAGKLDIYRMKAPASKGQAGCSAPGASAH